MVRITLRCSMTQTLYFQFLLIPEPTARSAVPGVSPGRGYLAQGEGTKVHQISWAHGYDPRVDLLTDLKNIAICQEWDKHIEDIKARFQFSKAYIWKITFHTMSFEAIFV